jgi:hypothetical protein
MVLGLFLYADRQVYASERGGDELKVVVHTLQP